MASELKPCPLCSADPSSKFTDIKAAIWCEPCGLHMEYSTAMVSLRIAEEHQRGILTKRWNTRPTPVAPLSPDATGKYRELETVEHQYWHNQTYEWLPTGFPDRYRKDGFLVRELVTRSQAEELLAAERAESDRLASIASQQMARAEQTELKERWLKEMVTTVISNPIGSVQHYRSVEDARLALGNPEAALSENEKLIQRAQKAEADNAAQAARIEELIGTNIAVARRQEELANQLAETKGLFKTADDLAWQRGAAIEALEAKLAAAENGVRYALANLRMNKSDEAFLASVLGRKPS
ncbi:hypothetical protein OHI65_14760 [Brucella sp. MAB-22]|uniref:hypothetical protein n=1 Tax=Brucella sp. MAB-22 TaxID=2986424 RepID=UPI002220B2A3|nr:hypothetical protein [Brucella sp. MAB-22]UYT57729.1 hypothetical protein OHI65_14760 [Brucella sp. MAB-22]